MAKRTQFYQKIPWTGGVNDSVDPGLLNDNELVTADNVVFSTSGSRLKRQGLSYLDTAIPEPDLRSSSGTTRTLKYTTNSIKKSATGSADQLLTTDEYADITAAVATYSASNTPITVSHTAQVATIQTLAKASITASSYFLLNSAEGGSAYYVWLNTTGSDVDPAITGRTGVEVDISADTTADEVASRLDTSLNALSDFSSSVSTDTVTLTWDEAGVAIDPTDGAVTTGFTFTVTTQGSSQVVYTASTSLTESETAAGEVTIERNESVLSVLDYWRTDLSNVQQQVLLSVTSRMNLFSYNGSNQRTKISGQEEITSVTTPAASTITTGDYWLLYSANDATEYYVWYNKAAGGGDPAPAGKTGIEVTIGGSDTAAQVATATASAIDGVSDFSASADSAVVTVTNADEGEATDASDVNSGVTISITSQGAAKPLAEVEQATNLVFNNKAIFAFNDLGVFPIYYRPETSAKYQKLLNAPDASTLTSYLSRVWCNDKSDPHRLHYSTTGNEEEWNGVGDSGAIDIVPGDGDPIGITAIFTYKGGLFVSKKNSLYRVLGDTPENFQVVPITKGLGAESPMVVNVDQDDAVFVSRRGFHSAQATEQFGDITSRFLSAKIQNTFNSWVGSRLNRIQGAWVPELNSMAFAVTSRGSENNDVWLYNVEIQAWYRWPGISCQALSTRLSANQTKLVFGTSDGRIIQAQNGDFQDFETVAYPYKVKTGRIYPGGNPNSTKAFKRVGFVYKPVGDFNFSVRVKIDNGSTQALTFAQESTTEKLGVDFILGQSVLGFDSVLSPYFSLIDGYGRGLTLEIDQTSLDQQVEIYGFIIEYEEEGFRQEVKTD